MKKAVYDFMEIRETGNDDTLICDICDDELKPESQLVSGCTVQAADLGYE